MKVIIAGSREFDDYEKLCSYCDYLLQDKDNIEIVSGKARGADALGERYAKERGYPIKPFPAAWDDIEDKPEHEIGINKAGKQYWKKAGYVRNEDMAAYADALIAFWLNMSKGTQHMINTANDYDLQIRIHRYGNQEKNRRTRKGTQRTRSK